MKRRNQISLFSILVILLLLLSVGLKSDTNALLRNYFDNKIKVEYPEDKQENLGPITIDKEAMDSKSRSQYFGYLNDNYFDEDINISLLEETDPYQNFSPLDELGRVGPARALIDESLMPKEERQDISKVKPTGFINKEYDFIGNKWLYNRCHLIGFQLTGENANELNLMTGTRDFNVRGMLPFEDKVANYVKKGGKIYYVAIPDFREDELVARGLNLKAIAVSDLDGNSKPDIEFNVYIYNRQPGVLIDYKTGESKKDINQEGFVKSAFR